jgi:hypothetical protein
MERISELEVDGMLSPIKPKGVFEAAAFRLAAASAASLLAISS